MRSCCDKKRSLCSSCDRTELCDWLLADNRETPHPMPGQVVEEAWVKVNRTYYNDGRQMIWITTECPLYVKPDVVISNQYSRRIADDDVDDMIDKVVKLIKAEKSRADIAVQLDLSTAQLKNIIKKAIKRGCYCSAHGRWTQKQEDILRRMYLGGSGYNEIAVVIGRTEQAVQKKSGDLGLPAQRKIKKDKQ